KGGPIGFSPWRPHVYLQFASDTTMRDAALDELDQNLQRTLADVHEDTRRALADLRSRMFWIALGAFAAVVSGGLWLVRLGLSPLQRLSEAVRRVSPQDFRLGVDPKDLPGELQPIAARLSETLDQLKRAFAREKQAAADISHELRTPLSALIANLELALRKPRSPDEYRQLLQECHESGLQMNQLVERLMSLARLDAGAAKL